jgi:hypothetical protein
MPMHGKEADSIFMFQDIKIHATALKEDHE